ncbi:MAG: endonuclease/exonuclease/phosphatase family protein [Planctomycetales bacterium]|nr:endonuclease/exonuclease/phosphatase family protein [Planctomycetales bacterium]
MDLKPDSPKNNRVRPAGLGSHTFVCATLLTSVGTLFVAAHFLLVLMSGWHPVLELSVHCSLHMLIAVVLLLPLSIVLGKRRSAVILGLSGAYLVFLVQPWSLIPVKEAAMDPTYTREIRVLSWNVLAGNHRLEDLASLIKAEDPDVLILIEVRPGLLDDLPEISARYPIALAKPGWQGGGIAAFSRVLGTEFRFEDFGYPDQPAVLATIPAAPAQAEKKLELLAMHTFSPLPILRTEHRDRQLSEFAKWSTSRQGPICLVGDLNVTPWARSFHQLLNCGFKDSRAGVGNCASWPRALGFLGIPIDHVLFRGQCQVANRRVLDRGPGSDHLPIAFTIRF